jgi:hypothetical protein
MSSGNKSGRVHSVHSLSSILYIYVSLILCPQSLYTLPLEKLCTLCTTPSRIVSQPHYHWGIDGAWFGAKPCTNPAPTMHSGGVSAQLSKVLPDKGRKKSPAIPKLRRVFQYVLIFEAGAGPTMHPRIGNEKGEKHEFKSSKTAS